MDNIRILNAEIADKEGEKYIRYTMEINGLLYDHELPVYDKEGNKNPVVDDILSLAQKKEKPEMVVPVEEDICDSKEKELSEDEDSEVENVTVYNEPKKNAKISKETKGYIAAGLAGILIGMGILAIFKGCDSSKKNDIDSQKDAINDINNQPSIEQPKEEELKIVYITEEEYQKGVIELCDHLNEGLGFNYKPVDLNAFYYSANMDNISNELFTKLVNENYLPDTDVDIIQSTFAVASDLITTFGQTGKMDVDFSKIFVNNEMVEVSERYAKEYEKIATSDSEQIKDIVTSLENYMIVNPEEEYNTLPVGGQAIFNWTIADTIGIISESKGVATSDAFKEKTDDITRYIKALSGEFECMIVEEADKKLQLTK